MRIAVIDYKLCDPSKCGFLCQRVCPINLQGKECIKREMLKIGSSDKERPVIVESLCIGCGICIKKCPLDAIRITNTPEELDETPIHRHGKNGFVLFRLPVPRKGVVGILGENGLGKSTALRILSGETKPNLGREDASWNEIIRIHRGNEIQPYLEKLSKGGIRAIYKPQALDAIKRVMGERDVATIADRETLEKFGLAHLAGRKINQLSGGELQKFLVCLAMSKDADIYLIDEPTSYLDVYQRVEAARVIRSADAPVVVIDHDLSTLDYMADYIHIFYGEPGVFGIVSKPMSVRNGINAFIEGFIKDDNVRIHPRIRFERSSEHERAEGGVVAEVPEIRKSYESFSLTVKGHEIRKDSVIGILGRNGIGKSTYMNIIGGVTQPDSGTVPEIKVSYKKQFIEPLDMKVEEYLGTMDQQFRLGVAEPLGVTRLMKKEMPDLSGGELQRVLVAGSLKQEADLYLLDEPCAFLDVRQRLELARVLRNFSSGRSVIVVDHDLMFISYVSDRLLVFEGTPGVEGHAETYSVKDGMNRFLKGVGLTFRKDPETRRPRANKEGSQKDQEMKARGVYFEG